MIVDMTIVGMDVDMATAQLMLLLRDGEGVQRVEVNLCSEAEGASRIVGSLSERFVSGLWGRAVKAKVEDGKIVDIGDPSGVQWIVGPAQADPAPKEGTDSAAELEMDIFTRP